MGEYEEPKCAEKRGYHEVLDIRSPTESSMLTDTEEFSMSATLRDAQTARTTQRPSSRASLTESEDVSARSTTATTQDATPTEQTATSVTSGPVHDTHTTHGDTDRDGEQRQVDSNLPLRVDFCVLIQ